MFGTCEHLHDMYSPGAMSAGVHEEGHFLHSQARQALRNAEADCLSTDVRPNGGLVRRASPACRGPTLARRGWRTGRLHTARTCTAGWGRAGPAPPLPPKCCTCWPACRWAAKTGKGRGSGMARGSANSNSETFEVLKDCLCDVRRLCLPHCGMQVLPPRDWEEAALARVQSGLGTGGPHRRARGSRSAAGAPDASEGNGSRSGQAALADGRGLPGPRASVDPQPLPLLLLCQAAWAAGALAAACPVSYGDGRERRVEALRRQLVAAAAAALAAQWPRGSLLRGEDAPPRGGVECGGIETPSWCQAVYAACAHDVAWAAVASGNENCLGLL